MSDDLNLNRDDFEDCFVDAPPPVSVADDLARGRLRLRRRRRMAGGAVAAVVAVVVIAVPIVTSQATRPIFDPAEPPTAVPTAGNPPGPCVPATISIKDALTDHAQRPIDEVKLQRSEENGEDVMLAAVATTGEVLLEIGRNDTHENDQTNLRPGRLYIEDPVTGQRTLVRGEDDLNPHTQTFFAAFDQSFVIWMETPDTTVNSSDWAMYAFDRMTGKISKIAGSDTTPDADIAPHQATLWNGTVYWYENRNSDNYEEAQFNIYSRKLGAGEPIKLVAENVHDPVAGDGWLYYQPYDFDPDDGYTIYRMSLADRKAEIFHQDKTGKTSGGLAASGDLVAWTEDEDVVVYRGTTQIARVVAKGLGPGYLTVGDDAVGFVTGDNGANDDLLLDLRQGCSLHHLAKAEGQASVRLAGRTITWSVEDPDNPDRSADHIGRLR